MVQVFRLVGKNGTGVFVGGHAEKAGVSTYASIRRPQPSWLLGKQNFSKPFFAFKTPAQLKSWFDADERVMLQRVGVRVKVYEVPEKHVIADESQLIFNKRMAKLVKELDVFSLTEI